MIPDDETWERLNAYYDGELDADASEAMEARLREEPELRSAYEDIRDLSLALKPMLPVKPLAAAAKSSVWPLRAGLAVAVAVAAALLFAVYQIRLSGPEPTPLDWHHTFASRAYSVLEPDSVRPVLQWINRDLELTSVNLTLVDVVMLDSGDIQLHYSGVNNCRLTLGAYSDRPVLPAAAHGMEVRSWSVGPIHFSLLAEGMAIGKFSAIHRLLVDRTNGSRRDTNTLLAVREATRNAVPCA